MVQMITIKKVHLSEMGKTGLPRVREIYFFLFKVRVLSENFANCQRNLEFLVNVRQFSGNFDNTRFKSSYCRVNSLSMVLGQS